LAIRATLGDSILGQTSALACPKQREFGVAKHLVKSACSFTLSAALVLPLAACNSMNGSSNNTTAPSSSTAATAAVTGTVDRSGATSTTDTTDTSKSTVGAAVTTAMAGSTATTSTTTAAATTTTTVAAPSTATTTAATTTAATTAAKTTTATTTASTAKTTASTTPATTATTTPATTATTTPSTTPTPAPTVVKKSISSWVSCGTAADDTAGATKAFAAARQGAFTLVVDCPVHLKSGLAIDKGIFIDNGTTVEFTGSGKIYVDNLFHPAFVIANSTNITLTNWNIEWDGIVPINPDVGGYELNGKFVVNVGITQPAGAFNDLILTTWLSANRSVTFDETQGYVKSVWVGGVNPMAVFFITGDSSNVVFTGLKLSVPTTVGGDHFLPMAVSFSANWKSQQTVTGKTPLTAAYEAVPHGITFSGVDFDGTLMGWQGNVRDAMFENITSHRYGDVMDANGGTTGGIGKWFPPPHLFYLNYNAAGDSGLFNTNIHISTVNDLGPRLGVARDKGGTDTVSGYILSLKLGCTECSVDTYTSNRPDGFMDVLPSSGLTVSNVTATFDSSFINNAFPAGLRFPSTGYSHVTFENIQMKDLAESTLKGLLGNAPYATNDTLIFSNFQVAMNRWAGSDLPIPTIGGASNNVSLNFTMSTQSMKVSYLEKATVQSTLKASPVTVTPGASTVLTWTSRDASSCAASGAWTGNVSTGGSKVVKIGASGNNEFDLNCQNSLTSGSASLVVLGQ
jgi:hypothetical protein